MIQLGQINQLAVARITGSGAFLEDEEGNDVLLPGKFMPADLQVDDLLSVFIYKDNEDRLIATTQESMIQVGKVSYLEVKQISKFGAFLFTGVDKDLLVPLKEQRAKMVEGGKYFVYTYIDEQTQRLTGTAKIDKILKENKPEFQQGDEVQIMIWSQSELGFNVIVNRKFMGLIYKNQLYKDVQVGQKMTAYINKVRSDGKLDIRMNQSAYDKVEPSSQAVMNYLQDNGGSSRLNDKSSPLLIKRTLGMSKKTFKKALGLLYKQGMIDLLPNGIQIKNK